MLPIGLFGGFARRQCGVVQMSGCLNASFVSSIRNPELGREQLNSFSPRDGSVLLSAVCRCRGLWLGWTSSWCCQEEIESSSWNRGGEELTARPGRKRQ